MRHMPPLRLYVTVTRREAEKTVPDSLGGTCDAGDGGENAGRRSSWPTDFVSRLCGSGRSQPGR